MYVVLRGTSVRVRKPDSSFVHHVMKRNVAIPAAGSCWIGFSLLHRPRFLTSAAGRAAMLVGWLRKDTRFI